MENKLIEFDELKEGKLIKRYKRFLADIELNDGTKITAHCANTGPMRDLLFEGAKVRVSFSDSKKRKLSWTWEQIQVKNRFNKEIWVGINTLFANKLVKTAIEKNYFREQLGEISEIKTEQSYGIDKKSRIDMLLIPKSSNTDNRRIYLEVKNTTWVKNDIALFPDTVTTRGQKHLKDLASILPKEKSVLVPCITRTDVNFFSPSQEADPCYEKLFKESIKVGMIVIPCCFCFHKDHITWERFLPTKLN